MARPPAAKEGDELRPFVVCDGYITADNDNVRKEAGDTIMLTFEQAKHFKAQGVIEVPLEEFGNDPAPTTPTDQKQAVDGGEADGSGKPAVGNPPAANKPKL